MRFKDPSSVLISFYLINFSALLYLIKNLFHDNLVGILSTSKFPYSMFQFQEGDLESIPLIGFCLALLLVISLPFLHLQATRIFWFISNFLVIGFDFTLTNGHSYHLFVWLSLLLSLPASLEKSAESITRLRQTIEFCQIQILLVYALSGLWKLIGLLSGIGELGLIHFVDHFRYALAQEFLNSNKVGPLGTFLIDQPLVSMSLGLLGFLFQIGSLPIIFFPQGYWLWGLMIGIFHLCTLATMNILFVWPVSLALCFLCFAETPNYKFTGPTR